MLRGCVAKEFAAFATNADRPIAHYLRALARDLNERTPGKGVGVIGECWSGGFALAAAVDDSVLAPVLSQPSLPIGLTAKQKADPGLSEAELKVVERRVAEDGLCALALRFSEDPMSPGARFATLKARLGDAFEVIEIDSKKGNAHGFGKMAHSVLTLEVREVDGHPAYEARKRVVEFLKERLARVVAVWACCALAVASAPESFAAPSRRVGRWPGPLSRSSSSSGRRSVRP